MNRELYDNITFCDYYEENGYAYLSNLTYNALIKTEIKTGMSEIIGYFPHASLAAKALHKRVTKYGNNLFFFPELGRDIVIYHMDSASFETIPIILPQSVIGKTKVAEVVICQNIAWIFPQYISQPLLKLNMDNLQIEVEESWNRQLAQYVDDAKSLMVYNVVENEGKAWFCIRSTNYIAEVNLNQMLIKVHKVCSDNVALHSISYDGTDFWLTMVNRNDVARWNQENSNVEWYSCRDGWKGGKPPYSKIICANEKRYVIPAYSDEIMQLDFEKKELEGIGKVSGKISFFQDERSQWPKFQEYEIKRNQVILFPLSCNSAVFINIATNEVSFKTISSPVNWDYSKFIRDIYLERRNSKNGYMYERSKADLQWIIELEKGTVDDYFESNINVGRKIWEKISSLIEKE